ncbi:adenylyltransferase/cytidyltransferase family protein [Planktotalea sp.]|uniref:adenylyltransferase/cytidyltransferase family protein n=1 Tax=Planktotalea sp. TaxID=2029877 RepID=UPI0025F3C77D|nr:adenylyltransferase/cytidyltransferase family protein [Planktotalea sp.]
MTTLLTYGAFDLFHIGHVKLLSRFAEMADEVIVGCSSDEFNALKGKTCIMPYEDRANILRACRFVSHVFAEHNWGQKRSDVIEFNADMFAMGADWEGKFDELSDLCDVVYLSHTEGVSTTKLKRRVLHRTPGLRMVG